MTEVRESMLPAKSVSAEVSVGKAIEYMLQEDVSLLLVVDGGGRAVGLVSESTLLAAAFDPPLRSDPISLHMERKFASVLADQSLDHVIETFLLHRVRFLPVLDSQRHPVGVVSRRELLRELMGRSGSNTTFSH